MTEQPASPTEPADTLPEARPEREAMLKQLAEEIVRAWKKQQDTQ